MSFLHELKRRSVFKVGVTYVIVAWLILQVVSVLVPMLSLPDWVGRFFILLIAVGFPFALVIAWAFEVTPDGVKLDVGKKTTESNSHGLVGALKLVAITAITGGFAFLIYDRLYDQPPPSDAGSADDPVPGQFEQEPADSTEASDQQRTIAVLPFDDMSPGGDQVWLADGLAEDLLDILSRIDGLRVIARTSSFALRGQNIAIVGESLGAGSVVEGSVRRAGEKLRVTAQLIRVSDQTHIWSNSYDRELDDVFEIQREIAGAVASAISEQLGLRDDEMSISNLPSESVDVRAWQLVKLADQNRNELTEDNLHRQIELCNRALEIEPGYARAYSCISSRSQDLWRFGLDTSESLVLTARDSAQRVLESDPGEWQAQNQLQFLELGSVQDRSYPATTESQADLQDVATLSYVFAHSGDTDRAARIWIDASASNEAADVRRKAYDDGGYVALIDTVISDHVTRSGSACTEDPAAAAFLLAVMNEEDRMFDCMQEAGANQHASEFFRLHPVFEPYRTSEKFREIVADD
ncbi:MAG: hypothetical protein GWP60_05680 [Gammaproteobacteria bacterium]|jgi:TolB-like protein|nr:hypothetical protein [Gammaproteobacteria bacterium]